MNRLIFFVLALNLVILNQTAYGAGEKVKLSSFNVKTSVPGTLDVELRKTPITVKAKLQFPKGSKEKVPLVIYLLHSGGFGKNDKKWLKFFRESGFATLWVDQYTARGMTLKDGLGTAQAGMSDMSYLSDVFAAIKFAKSDPRIDGEKIITFGSSWGGGVQMYLMSDWFTKMVGSGETVAGHIALAPACYFTVDKPKPSSSETRTLIIYGEIDNWNEPGPCKDYVGKLSAQGANIVEKTIKNGHHGFDGMGRKKSKKVTTYHCQITFDPETMQGYHRRENKSADLSKDWGNLWDDCVKKSKVTTRGTEEQLRETRQLVSDHLNQIISQN